MNKSDVGQIHDFFNEMSSEEIKCFKIKQAKLSVASSPWSTLTNEELAFDDDLNVQTQSPNQ
ncbi:852_t:CDS:2 [Entrophospora sp. SA101]|nr:852_t:CDS:2 [Entrophospora sp. SA101]